MKHTALSQPQPDWHHLSVTGSPAEGSESPLKGAGTSIKQGGQNTIQYCFGQNNSTSYNQVATALLVAGLTLTF